MIDSLSLSTYYKSKFVWFYINLKYILIELPTLTYTAMTDVHNDETKEQKDLVFYKT